MLSVISSSVHKDVIKNRQNNLLKKCNKQEIDRYEIHVLQRMMT